MNEKPKLNLIDLFAGIGGFSLAAHWLGWQAIAFVEKDEFCQKVLRKNFGQDIYLHDDITTFSGKPFRGRCGIITAGIPCQPFSTASRGLRQGTDDNRYLWSEVRRVAKESKPSWVVIENVIGFIELALENVCSDLENDGYETQTFVIPACAVEKDHIRERVWVLGYSDRNRKSRLSFDAKMGGLSGCGCRTRYMGKTDGFSSELDIAGSRDNRRDRLRVIGNSVVPQIAFEIFKAIEQTEIDYERQRASDLQTN